MKPFLLFIVRELRWRLAAAAAVAIGTALAEGTGLLLLVPLVGSIGLAVDDGTTAGVAAAITGVFQAAGIRPSLLSVLAVFVAVSAVRAAIQRIHVVLNPALEQQLTVSLQRRLYAAMLKAQWGFFVTRRQTDLLRTVTTDVDRASAVALRLLTLFTNAAVTAVYVGISFWLSPALTTLVTAGGAVVLWTVRGRSRHSAEASERYLDADRQHFHFASESLAGVKVAKSLGAEARDVAIFDTHMQARAAVYLELLRSFARTQLWLDLASALLVSVLLFAAVEWLAVTGAGLLLLIFAFARVMPRLTAIQESVQVVSAGLPSFRNVVSLTREAEAEAEQLSGTLPPRLPMGTGIRLDRVSYAYPTSARSALEDVSLDIPAGWTVAIVGPSGAGKSTLADLLLGLLRPSAGYMAVAEKPLTPADIPAVRQMVGYVPQDGFLLHDTVRANLLWAKPGATDAELWTALERAAASDFVRARPEGLDMIVGDRGVRLSGGERQRLALARALLTEPDLLVLDEATSALDPPNERQILDAVRHLGGQMTTVIVTHRLSAIRGADVIYVLENGRMVEAGTWAELAGRNGAFTRLQAAQQPGDVQLGAFHSRVVAGAPG